MQDLRKSPKRQVILALPAADLWPSSPPAFAALWPIRENARSRRSAGPPAPLRLAKEQRHIGHVPSAPELAHLTSEASLRASATPDRAALDGSELGT